MGALVLLVIFVLCLIVVELFFNALGV